MKCPKNCNYRGICDSNAICKCYIGYFGNECEKIIHCPFNCTGNGLCQRNKKCLCNPGYTGIACDEKIKKQQVFSLNTTCSPPCTSHGFCNEAYSVCECDEHYSGEDCSQLIQAVGREDIRNVTFNLSELMGGKNED
jgi:hypothetical protein